MSCFICENKIEIKNPKRENCSICEKCVNDRRLTYSLFDVETMCVDKSVLKKLYYKNFVMYSKKEIDKLINCDSLSHKDIFLLNESDLINAKSSERLALVKYLCKKKDFDFIEVICDKWVDAFVDFGMINFKTDKEFWKDVIERFTN